MARGPARKPEIAIEWENDRSAEFTAEVNQAWVGKIGAAPPVLICVRKPEGLVPRKTS